MDSVVEEEAVEVAKQIKEEIEELAVEAVAVELVALLVMVDKVEILEEDLDLVVDNQVEQVLKPLEVVAVAVEELVALLDLVDKVEILEEDLVQEQVNLVEQVLKPLEVVAVAVVIMLVKQVVHLVDQLDRHLVTLEVVEVTKHQEVVVEEMELP